MLVHRARECTAQLARIQSAITWSGGMVVEIIELLVAHFMSDSTIKWTMVEVLNACTFIDRIRKGSHAISNTIKRELILLSEMSEIVR